MQQDINLQAILTQTDQAIAERWGQNCTPDRQQHIHQLVNEISSLGDQAARLKKEKQQVSRAFKTIDSDNDRLQDLKAQMTTISSQLKQSSKEKKRCEQQLKALFQAEQMPTLPLRFNAPYPEPDKTSCEIRHYSMDEPGQWNDYVAGHPHASAYHGSSWQRVLSQSFGHQSHNLTAVDADGKMIGILPLTKISSRLFGSFLVSLPHSNYGGPLGDSPQIERSLMQAAAKIYANDTLDHIECRCMKPVVDWPTRDEKVSMLLPLPDNCETLDKHLGSKLRAQINQAKLHALQARVGHTELLEDFYKVFAANMRDLGTPVYGKNFFAQVQYDECRAGGVFG